MSRLTTDPVRDALYRWALSDFVRERAALEFVKKMRIERSKSTKTRGSMHKTGSKA